jgi:hypothetical protein
MEFEARLSEADKREIAASVAAIVLEKLNGRADPLPADALISEPEAAAHLGVEAHVLRDARGRREIQYHRIGKFVRYDRAQIEAYKQRCLRNGDGGCK